MTVKRTLQMQPNPPGSFPVLTGWIGYFWVAFRLNGCGGLQCSEFVSDTFQSFSGGIALRGRF
jgi:hypothetical protein